MAVETKRRGGKSILMTPDPYHTPGYGGFCPQFKYQIGETFGRTTSRLLTDKSVASSGRIVIANITPLNQEDPRPTVIQSRKQSWGDQKLFAKVVPGYTGFIPKSQHYFGKRYADNCLSAISDFERNQLRHSTAISRIKGEGALNQLPAVTKERSLTAIAEPEPYISKISKPHSMSPYYMKNDNVDKKFVSGYTGFVPRARGLIGSGYPIITHNALNEFTDDLLRIKESENRPIDLGPMKPVHKPTKPIYPVESGLVPHYTGHIPGEKFRYGQTFGHSTENALKYKRPAVAK